MHKAGLMHFHSILNVAICNLIIDGKMGLEFQVLELPVKNQIKLFPVAV